MYFITLLFMTVLSLIVTTNYRLSQPAFLRVLPFDTEANDDCSHCCRNEQ